MCYEYTAGQGMGLQVTYPLRSRRLPSVVPMLPNLLRLGVEHEMIRPGPSFGSMLVVLELALKGA